MVAYTAAPIALRSGRRARENQWPGLVLRFSRKRTWLVEVGDEEVLVAVAVVVERPRDR